MRRTQRVAAVTTALLLALPGCGRKSDQPEIGRVTGLITLDGQPLADAGVAFQPTGLRGSLGRTDNEGRYSLKYLTDVEGAVVGKHLVRIDRVGGNEYGRVEHLPARYNAKSELEREVKPGKNVIDFELTSDK